jgi:hypothetical protein
VTRRSHHAAPQSPQAEICYDAIVASMAPTDLPTSQLIWGPPADLLVQSRRQEMRENLRFTCIATITFAICLPIVAIFNSQMHLALPVLKLSFMMIGVFVLFPWLLVGFLIIVSRVTSQRPEPRQDLYQLTPEGLHLPQYRTSDLPFVKWSDVQWWELRNHKRLTGYRIIVLRERCRLRKIWLPGGDLDEQVLAAFRSLASVRTGDRARGRFFL